MKKFNALYESLMSEGKAPDTSDKDGKKTMGLIKKKVKSLGWLTDKSGIKSGLGDMVINANKSFSGKSEEEVKKAMETDYKELERFLNNDLKDWYAPKSIDKDVWKLNYNGDMFTIGLRLKF